MAVYARLHRTLQQTELDSRPSGRDHIAVRGIRPVGLCTMCVLWLGARSAPLPPATVLWAMQPRWRVNRPKAVCARMHRTLQQPELDSRPSGRDHIAVRGIRPVGLCTMCVLWLGTRSVPLSPATVLWAMQPR